MGVRVFGPERGSMIQYPIKDRAMLMNELGDQVIFYDQYELSGKTPQFDGVKLAEIICTPQSVRITFNKWVGGFLKYVCLESPNLADKIESKWQDAHQTFTEMEEQDGPETETQKT